MPVKRKSAPKRKAKAKAKPKAKAKRAKKSKAPVGKEWAAAEVKQLRALYKTKSASAIAKMLGRSLASVRGKISALGLKKPASAKKAKAKSKAKPKRRAKAKKTTKAKAKPKRRRRR